MRKKIRHSPAFLLCACCALLRPTALRADTVALWHFDEEQPGAADVVPGKFGRGFRPGRTMPRPDDALRAGPRLNPGAHDWTIEAWLRLDARAAGEGVIFEVGVANELVTRFSVLPGENAFGLTAVALGEEAGGIGARRIELPNPAGPPAIVAQVRTITLALPLGAAIPRDTWCHAALVHHAARGELRLFLDGKPRAVAVARIDALPPGSELRVSIGCDGSGARRLAGVLDELRISDHAVYRGEFAPPGSFAREQAKR